MSCETAGAGALRGWGCTPTGDPPAAAVSSQEEPKPGCLPEVIRRGWRRTALYGILVFLMILVFLNIGLTLWVISALKLTMSGIGPIKIVNGGIQLASQAWVVDNLIVSTISSQTAQPITVHSHRNFSVLVAGPDNEQAKLVMKRDSIECSGRVFEVRDARGGEVFRASRDEVKVSADALALDSVGGIRVKSAVQVPLVKAPPGSDLLLESSTRQLELRAPQSINLESRAGGIDIKSHSNIKLDSVVGAIKLDAANIIIDHLKLVNVTAKPQKGVKQTKVFQLCACATGKLFLAAADAICEADTDLCR